MEFSNTNYQVHTLKLYEDINCQKTEDDGNGILYMCKTQCTKKTSDPSKEDLLSKGTQDSISFAIPQGDYLFVQGFLPAGVAPFSEDGTPAEEMFSASNALFLDFLWQELEMIDDDIFVRLLLHEGDYVDKKTGEKKSAGTVFQLFRRTHL